MCSRYSLSKKAIKMVKRDFPKLVDELSHDYPGKDVHPSEPAACLSFEADKLVMAEKVWGYPSFDSKLIINARGESVYGKPTFISGFRQKRIVLVADKFYEWDRRKEKHTIERADSSVLYFAGIADNFDGRDHFVIITRASDESTAYIHDRMPLILEKEDIYNWLSDYEKGLTLLNKKLPSLTSFKDFEQQSLF
ncbi:MAG: SOS response-associated peptidase family protein [Finegoldia sp.]|nr:SOS response-associated peptidase family protein [Finegoldia sp.]